MNKRIRSPTPLIAALLLIALLLAIQDRSRESRPSTVASAQEVVYVQRVIDGDTFEIDDGRRVRLLGIDCPELHAPDGPVEFGARAATDWMTARVAGKQVILKFGPERTDRYDRLLAWVYLPSGEFINRDCLEAGHARLVTRYGLPADLEPELYRAEATARLERRGVWADE